MLTFSTKITFVGEAPQSLMSLLHLNSPSEMLLSITYYCSF